MTSKERAIKLLTKVTEKVELLADVPQEKLDDSAELLGSALGQVIGYRIYKRMGAPKWVALAIMQIIGELQMLRREVKKLAQPREPRRANAPKNYVEARADVLGAERVAAEFAKREGVRVHKMGPATE